MGVRQATNVAFVSNLLRKTTNVVKRQTRGDYLNESFLPDNCSGHSWFYLYTRFQIPVGRNHKNRPEICADWLRLRRERNRPYTVPLTR